MVQGGLLDECFVAVDARAHLDGEHGNEVVEEAAGVDAEVRGRVDSHATLKRLQLAADAAGVGEIAFVDRLDADVVAEDDNEDIFSPVRRRELRKQVSLS